MSGHPIDYDALDEAYARHRGANPRVLRALIDGASVGATSRVLDIGCGTANYARATAAMTGSRVVGMDPSIGMLTQAAAHAAEVRLCQGSAGGLPFRRCSFDLAFSVDVIHHVPDTGSYYRELLPLLGPGSRACTVTDSDEIIRTREPLATYFPGTVEADLRRYPLVSRLQEEMAAAGFADIALETVELAYEVTDPGPYRAKAFSCLHLISEAAWREGVDRMAADLTLGPIRGVSRYVLIWGRKAATVRHAAQSADSR
ncbi:methyltransferase domain-containing protein [Candidatus Poribacteria bacterium]|nr:methyltransferase domain-containing protein [Candidatus Poribacteria bacterium]MBT7804206.1 methyltransferase domain-containing protein [Candidatus Poribacteria bacterium]